MISENHSHCYNSQLIILLSNKKSKLLTKQYLTNEANNPKLSFALTFHAVGKKYKFFSPTEQEMRKTISTFFV